MFPGLTDLNKSEPRAVFLFRFQTAPEFLPEEGQTCQFGPYKVTGRSYTSHDRYQEGFLYMVKSKRVSGPSRLACG